MEALSFNSLKVPLRNLKPVQLVVARRPGTCLPVHCQGGGNVVKSSVGVSSTSSSTFTEMERLQADPAGTAVMEGGSLVLAPNGRTENVAVKEMMPYVINQGHSLVEMDGGVGIIRFLRGKRLFITGATGFLAKVLVEKILRTVPDVGKIFLLIKAKDEDAARGRLTNEIMNSELFDCLRQTYGASYERFLLSKLVPVPGDVCEQKLGLGQDLTDCIADEVDIIINSAANTTFDERYDVAIGINTLGARNLMSFAKRCNKVKLFLQVSTAYVNGQRQGNIPEKPFSIGDSIARESLNSKKCNGSASFLTLDVEREISLAISSKKGLEDHATTQKMKELGLERAKKFGWQDTYVFTKAMGEMVIDDMRGDIPVVIIRPSVIESTWKEPFPGWMEGNRMMDPIVLYYGKGQLTGFLVDPDGVLDVVPADMVVNATLAAIARHGMAAKPDIAVYQVASSVVNPLVFSELALLLYEHYCSSPCIDPKGRPIPVSSMKLFNSMEEFSDHLCRDASRRTGSYYANEKLSRRLEAICRKAVDQAKYLANIYEPYTFYRGRFDNSNTQMLMESMSEEEKRCFGFDVQRIDWKDYITKVHIPGLRRHVMKGRKSTM